MKKIYKEIEVRRTKGELFDNFIDENRNRDVEEIGFVFLDNERMMIKGFATEKVWKQLYKKVNEKE